MKSERMGVCEIELVKPTRRGARRAPLFRISLRLDDKRIR